MIFLPLLFSKPSPYSFFHENHPKMRPSPPAQLTKKGANTRDSTAISLMRMLSEGPEVSLRGSPTCWFWWVGLVGLAVG